MRMNGGCRRASEPVQRASCTVGAGSALGRSSNPGSLFNERASQRTILMMRKFAVALIATTMLVAPALAADTVKATPAATATTSAPTATPAAATVTKTDKEIKKTKVAHRHVGRHLAMVKHGKHSGNVKT